MHSALSTLSLVLLLAAAVRPELSPDGTCGQAKAGNNKEYTCPSDEKCCSPSGYCGSTDEHCLKSVGCQDKFSNSTTACVNPVNGTTVSPDGTCGNEGVGEFGYRCPEAGDICCSIAGYYGNTTAHCLATNGCQSAYGICQ
ncbi:carbohydrate-binding module family 18 protein [Durotheca rogersii]|uniref:carbohydrate-binding module family 18 protein n=1 Tax=Durotheca rogersii TaxID=419775 RepID=UPI00221E9286|nr:carbohydrate-binding module family 18 protein [Durotheca rogersii]KAI5856140.1 carbohydrate-binding module family 18 protein [Durotheca rogersii]